jgi:hypothetical protein
MTAMMRMQMSHTGPEELGSEYMATSFTDIGVLTLGGRERRPFGTLCAEILILCLAAEWTQWVASSWSHQYKSTLSSTRSFIIGSYMGLPRGILGTQSGGMQISPIVSMSATNAGRLPLVYMDTVIESQTRPGSQVPMEYSPIRFYRSPCSGTHIALSGGRVRKLGE